MATKLDGTAGEMDKDYCLQFSNRLGLGDTMFWNMMLKKNNAMGNKFDKPFAQEKAR